MTDKLYRKSQCFRLTTEVANNPGLLHTKTSDPTSMVWKLTCVSVGFILSHPLVRYTKALILAHANCQVKMLK